MAMNIKILVMSSNIFDERFDLFSCMSMLIRIELKL